MQKSDESMNINSWKDTDFIPDDRNQRKKFLQWFDDALEIRPTLAEIFKPRWRAKYWDEFLSAPKDQIQFVPAYAAPWLERNGRLPKGFQYHIEQGAAFIKSKAKKQAREDVFSRLRGDGNGCTSAGEEILLALGLVSEFGVESVEPYPTVTGGSREFRVHLGDRTILLEATGKILPNIRCPGPGGRAFDNRQDTIALLDAVLGKITQHPVEEPIVILISEYSVDLALSKAELSSFVASNFGCTPLLGVAYISDYRFRDMCFVDNCARKFSLGTRYLEQLKRSIAKAFF